MELIGVNGDPSVGFAALLRIGFRCWPLPGRSVRRGAQAGPPLALPARLPLCAGFAGANRSRWSRLMARCSLRHDVVSNLVWLTRLASVLDLQ